MKMKWFCGVLTASLMMASQVMAQLTDDASNYGAPNPDWNTGSNEGDGFGPWTITDGGGGHFLGSSTEGDGSRTRMRTSLPFASRSRAMRPPNVPVAPTTRIKSSLLILDPLTTDYGPRPHHGPGPGKRRCIQARRPRPQ